jgi:hypothetical protein
MRDRRQGNFDLRAAKRILLRLHEEYPELHLFPKPSIDILMGARAQMQQSIPAAKFVEIMCEPDAIITLGWLTYCLLQDETAPLADLG